MKTLITKYRNVPGQHCGSIAMKNLLYHYCNIDLPEEVVFGLGSGIECMYMVNEKLDPPVVVFGRSITMEVDLAEALGVDYREIMEMDNDKAWEDVRLEVAQGRPTMLTGDIFYLDYREYKVRFPAHRFVLVGFDDEARKALVADRVDPEPQACSYGAVARSRNPSTGLSTFNLWGKFHDTKVKHTLEEACLHAFRKSSGRMHGSDTSQADLLMALGGSRGFRIHIGLEGIARLSEEVADWREHENCRFIASYVSQSLEKFGTGGGNFRKMYAFFLRWARERMPDRVPERLPGLADRSARSWTQLASTLEGASKEPEQKSIWKQASVQAKAIHGIEAELFETLGSI